MRKVLMSGAAFLTSSVTLTGEEIESLAPDESLKDMEKQLSLLERYLKALESRLKTIFSSLSASTHSFKEGISLSNTKSI